MSTVVCSTSDDDESIVMIYFTNPPLLERLCVLLPSTNLIEFSLVIWTTSFAFNPTVPFLFYHIPMGISGLDVYVLVGGWMYVRRCMLCILSAHKHLGRKQFHLYIVCTERRFGEKVTFEWDICEGRDSRRTFCVVGKHTIINAFLFLT